MSHDMLEKVKLVELRKDDASLPTLNYRHKIANYYDLKISREYESWKMELALKPLEKTFDKNSESRLFEAHIEEPQVFVSELDGEQVGWIELGYEKWNNRMRVWEFLVKEEFRKEGIGTLLMNHAVKLAKERGARMLVLETQSCNVPAISFYLNFGFELIGFDAAAYSNEDIARREVRLEFGLKIT
jgi:ribosomal protein S18 acetylase RimI-like enzyme